MAASEDSAGPERPPTRQRGSRLVTRAPSAVRQIAAMREEARTAASRIRPEPLTFAPADPALGAPCAAGSFTPVHTTLVYRAGRRIFVDLLIYTGAASAVEARLAVPDLSLTGVAAATPVGGTTALLRVELAFPDAWPPGEAHLVNVEAYRSTGGDATTSRVLRARTR
uniref:hypothetical protein n=1 Tax=Nonomuraea sp. CA-251285 TaxID=3240002 RepID=UPI003F493A9C